jgi:glutamyl/glutaminyl-tRNA synthetase
MEDFWKDLSDKAKATLAKAGVNYEELKGTASEKFAELSAKADKLAAEGKAEAAEAAAELKALRDRMAAHEGGALGYISDKAKELYGEAKEELAEASEKGSDFWEKAKDYVADKTDDARQFLVGKDKPEEEKDESKPA